jgi:hypothetical protein
MGNSSSNNVSKIIPGGLIGERGNPSSDLNEIIKKIFSSSDQIFNTKYVGNEKRGGPTPQKSDRVIPIEQSGYTHTTKLLYMCIFMLKIKIALLQYPNLEIEPHKLRTLIDIDNKLNESQINMTSIMSLEELYSIKKVLEKGHKDEIIRNAKMLILEFYKENTPISEKSINNIQEIRQKVIDLRLSQLYVQQLKEEAEANAEQARIQLEQLRRQSEQGERQRQEIERQIREQANAQYKKSLDEAIKRINEAAAEVVKQEEETRRQQEEAIIQAAAEEEAIRLLKEAIEELVTEQTIQRLKDQAEAAEAAENIEKVKQFEEQEELKLSGEKRNVRSKKIEVKPTNPNEKNIDIFESYIESNENPITPCEKIILELAKMKVSENDDIITKCPICLMNIVESFLLEPIESNKNQQIICYPSDASNTTFIMIHADCFRELIKPSFERLVKEICPTTRQQYGTEINHFYLLMLNNDDPSASICQEYNYSNLKRNLGINYIYGGSKRKRITSKKKRKSSKKKKSSKKNK